VDESVPRSASNESLSERLVSRGDLSRGLFLGKRGFDR
jgi:hypothetical protein